MYLSTTLVGMAVAGAAGLAIGWWTRGGWDRLFGLKRPDRDYPQERRPGQRESWRDYWW